MCMKSCRFKSIVNIYLSWQQLLPEIVLEKTKKNVLMIWSLLWMLCMKKVILLIVY